MGRRSKKQRWKKIDLEAEEKALLQEHARRDLEAAPSGALFVLDKGGDADLKKRWRSKLTSYEEYLRSIGGSLEDRPKLPKEAGGSPWELAKVKRMAKKMQLAEQGKEEGKEEQQQDDQQQPQRRKAARSRAQRRKRHRARTKDLWADEPLWTPPAAEEQTTATDMALTEDAASATAAAAAATEAGQKKKKKKKRKRKKKKKKTQEQTEEQQADKKQQQDDQMEEEQQNDKMEEDQKVEDSQMVTTSSSASSSASSSTSSVSSETSYIQHVLKPTIPKRHTHYTPSTSRGLPIPDEGLSYRPHEAAHQDLLGKVTARVLKQRRKQAILREKLRGDTVDESKELPEVQGRLIVPRSAGAGDDEEGEGEGEGDVTVYKGKVTSHPNFSLAKTQAQRNKDRKKKEYGRDRALAQEKARRARDLDKLDVILREVRREEQQRQAKLKARKLADARKAGRTKRLGKIKFKDIEDPVLLSSQVPSTLRQLPTDQANPIVEHFKLLQKRNLIEPRRHHKQRKAKLKRFTLKHKEREWEMHKKLMGLADEGEQPL